ncbi:MAG: hypothetical protein KGD61_10340 [Candidatus Lokiarchaeota archaeon]|nr:hypothetical protein [Candidatus Lokiarchaeota archaeon]
MNQKLKIIWIIGILNIVIFSSCFSLISKAELEHEIGFTEGTELIWEVTELDLESFREVFGFDPNYELGDQIRMIIRNIGSSSGAWIITVEFWDYKTDWGLSGRTFNVYINKQPEFYADYLFILTPVEDYIEQAIAELSSEYYRSGLSIFKQGKSDTGMDYVWEKEFDPRGILIAETFYDEFDQVIIKSEGKFRIIPFGINFVGFTMLAIIAIIVVSIKKKNLRIKIV